MPAYFRQPEDKAYRLVYISVSNVPSFQNFTEENKTVNYPNQDVVLEILRKDGTTKLIYSGEPSVAHYSMSRDTITVSPEVPTARLWVRRRDGKGIPYKLPAIPAGREGTVGFWIPAGTADLELVGDPYFEKVYPTLTTSN